MTSPLLEFRGVGRVFEKGNRTVALRSVNLEIFRGEFVAITGPSGSGKSTILNILGLLDRPSVGEYEVDGTLVSDLTEEQRDRLRGSLFGFVFQDSYTFPADTTARNVALGLRVQGYPRSTQSSSVASSLAAFGLSHRADSPAASLSGGERQRLAIARALALAPQVVLADEPTGSLDAENTAVVMSILQALNAAGHTIIVVTHDPAVAAAASRQIRMNAELPGQELRGNSHDPARSREDPGSKPDIVPPQVSRARRWRQRTSAIEDALSTITSNSARTLLLLVALTVGSSSLVAAVGLSQSASQQVSQRLALAELDEVRVALPDASDRPAADDWIDRITSLEGVRSVGIRLDISGQSAGVTALPALSGASDQKFNGQVIGADAALLELYGTPVYPSGAASLLDSNPSRNVALIGHDVAPNLGIGSLAAGKQVWVGGTAYDVVGFIESSERDQFMSQSIVIPVASAATLSPNRSSLVVRTALGLPSPMREAIPLALDPGNPASIQISATADLRELRTGVADDLSSLVSLTAAVTLILAVLSAGATMYMSTRARAGEIGLRRAFGTSQRRVAMLFMLEGGLIGLAGGVSGAAFGSGALVAITFARGWVPVMSGWLLAVGVATGLATGILAAILPSLRAARTDPAVALRQ